MAFESKYASIIETTEPVTLTAPGASITSVDVKHDAHNTSAQLSGTTSVPVTKSSYFAKALSSGTATIDLTTLTGPGGAVDFTGLKVQIAKFKNPVGNAAITITFGASNPYLLLGSGWKIIILAGQEATFYLNEAAPDVAAGAKNIDLAGTGTQQLTVSLVAG